MKLLVHRPSSHRRARKFKEEFLLSYFGKPNPGPSKAKGRWPSIAAWNTVGSNIVGVGFGQKEVNGSGVGAPEALRVYVRKKLPKKGLGRRKRIPKYINGLPTDVIEAGPFKAVSDLPSGGCSGGNPKVGRGTLGCVVRGRSGKPDRYLLSCFHVLADIQDPRQYEEVDVADQNAPIAELWKWMYFAASGNLVDCAIARLFKPDNFMPDIRGIGRPNTSPAAAYVQQPVMKSGANPPYVTLGFVADVSVDTVISYPQGDFGFVNQILVRGANGPFAYSGDSGSLVVESGTIKPIGLLFAADGDFALVNPIGAVLDDLDVVFA